MALVITIIILLILAGITINMTIGQRGILTRAQEAGKNYQQAAKDEEQQLANFLDEADKIIKNVTTGGTSSGKKLITFYVEEFEFQAEEGMTWGEFVESDYNPTVKAWLVKHGYDSNSELNSYFEEGERVFVYKPNVVFAQVLLEGKENEEHAVIFEENEVTDSTLLIDNRHYVCDESAACVFPNSEILVSNIRETTEARDIQEGHDIAYYDFETNSVEIGTVSSVYIHKKARNFVRYTFTDGTFLEATDYHPIYSKNGWRSLTRRNGYEVPQIGEEIKTLDGWKVITNIETWTGLEDCYDFGVVTKEGKKVSNYFANGTLVENSI